MLGMKEQKNWQVVHNGLTRDNSPFLLLSSSFISGHDDDNDYFDEIESEIERRRVRKEAWETTSRNKREAKE